MKVITGNVTTCNGCLTAMEFDESDIIPAIKCPTCSKLIEVNHPLPAIAIDLNSKSWDEIIEILKTKSGKALGLGAKKNITLKNGEFYTVQITHRNTVRPRTIGQVQPINTRQAFWKSQSRTPARRNTQQKSP